MCKVKAQQAGDVKGCLLSRAFSQESVEYIEMQPVLTAGGSTHLDYWAYI